MYTASPDPVSYTHLIKRLGADAIYFSPVFESDTHGYNTRDYTKIDTRLGTNKDFANVCYNPVSYTHLDVYKRQALCSLHF